MKVRCTGHSTDTVHNLTPTHMALVILAYQNGDMQTVSRKGNVQVITSKCLLEAPTADITPTSDLTKSND